MDIYEYTHKKQLELNKQWKIMDKADKIKKLVDDYRETYNNEDANIINKLMNKIIAIQEKYNDDSDY
tara:strand:- start:1808 stop:2008 length:201 start_codon:yes stop_codon:yes gene_type:complete